MDLEERKKLLEIEKLEHEVRLQKKPLLFVSTYAKVGTVVLQLITGAVAILFAYKNNWFNFQNDKLAVQKMSLEYDIKEFSQTKKNVLDSIKNYRHENDSMFRQNYALKIEILNLQGIVSKANENLDIIDSLTNSNLPINFVASDEDGEKLFNMRKVRTYLAGKIRDEKHDKIVNANVTGEFFRGGGLKENKPYMIQNVKSDANGYFKVGANVAMDSPIVLIRIRISKKGYKDYLSEPECYMSGNRWKFYYLKNCN
jgi:hypothetical protein